MKKLKKRDFKKLALMGIAGGTLLAGSASADMPTDHNTSQLLAFGGCGGSKGTSCGGSMQAYRNSPPSNRYSYNEDQMPGASCSNTWGPSNGQGQYYQQNPYEAANCSTMSHQARDNFYTAQQDTPSNHTRPSSSYGPPQSGYPGAYPQTQQHYYQSKPSSTYTPYTPSGSGSSSGSTYSAPSGGLADSYRSRNSNGYSSSNSGSSPYSGGNSQNQSSKRGQDQMRPGQDTDSSPSSWSGQGKNRNGY